MSIVILVSLATAREGDAGILAVTKQFVVDELAAIVGIHA